MTSSEEVIDNYLLWELCKKEGLKEKIIEGAPEEELLEEIERIREYYDRKDYSFEEKKEKLKELDHNPSHRIEVFQDCTWNREKVEVEDLGTTLPHAMGLPPEIISGSIPEVVEFVKKADPEKYQSVKYIHSLKEVPRVLNQFLPWIIHPGKILRKQEKMIEVHGEKNWEIKDTWGAINEGNHRTIAKILADDSKEIECFVGQSETLE